MAVLTDRPVVRDAVLFFGKSVWVVAGRAGQSRLLPAGTLPQLVDMPDNRHLILATGESIIRAEQIEREARPKISQGAVTSRDGCRRSQVALSADRFGQVSIEVALIDDRRIIAV